MSGKKRNEGPDRLKEKYILNNNIVDVVKKDHRTT